MAGGSYDALRTLSVRKIPARNDQPALQLQRLDVRSCDPLEAQSFVLRRFRKVTDVSREETNSVLRSINLLHGFDPLSLRLCKL
jgi:hypothetical protein